MAIWKKIIVSGSNISQLSNDSNYLVQSQDSAILSGSFSGSFQGDGSNLTGIPSNLTISGSTGGGSVSLLTQTLVVAGTTNEIETTATGQTITVGLPNNVVIGNDLTVTGDLLVQGDTVNFNVANLDVEDKFILLGSGSVGASEGGIVISQGGQSGEAFAWDTGQSRFGFTGSFDSTTASIVPDAFVSAVIDENNGGADIAKYQKNGNIKIDTGGSIWIYS